MLLTDNTLWLASPDQFNDPFDCALPLRFELGDTQQIATAYKEVIKIEFPDIDDDYADDLANKRSHEFNPCDASLISHLRLEWTKAMNEMIGVCALSPVPDDIIMWSHYADCHRGFCAGLSAAKLEDWHEEVGDAESGSGIRLIDVEYCDEMPVLNPHVKARWEVILDNVRAKSTHWSYEKEWRLIGIGMPRTALVLPPEVLEVVLIGCQMSADDAEDIIEILRKRKHRPKLYRAIKHGTQYRLNFEAVPY